jgi:hypothetical protein
MSKMSTKPHKPTPLMQVWMKDAQEFGISHEQQKGLMFLTAFCLRATYQPSSLEDWISFTRKLSDNISESAPHIPHGQGVNYSRKNISPLLAEFAKRFVGDGFAPRSYAPASLYAGEVFEIEGKPYEVRDEGWVWEGNPMLPSCLCEETWQMADWDEVMTSLCAQIGEAINMDLEGAYLAGFLYFERQYGMDPEATLQIAQLVSGMLPPKFMWFRHLMNFDAKMAAQGNPMQKVLDCFLVGIPNEAPLLYRLVTFLSDQLHYEAPGKRRQGIWDDSLVHFACIVASQRDWFEDGVFANCSDYGAVPEDDQPDRQDVASLTEYLKVKEWAVPNSCKSLEEALGTVAAQIEARWGYRILDDSEDLTPADNWTRRACTLHVCTVNSVIRPGWNAFE